jgi:hypothetical protein
MEASDLNSRPLVGTFGNPQQKQQGLQTQTQYRASVHAIVGVRVAILITRLYQTTVLLQTVCRNQAALAINGRDETPGGHSKDSVQKLRGWLRRARQERYSSARQEEMLINAPCRRQSSLLERSYRMFYPPIDNLV